jgi:hypothetical protein
MMEKPLNPHMTNTNSTIANEMPAVGADSAPPELLTSVDSSFTDPKDSVPENTQRMTGGTQSSQPEDGANRDLDVGEIEGSEFKTQPKYRDGEDSGTIRARLLCPLFAHHHSDLASSRRFMHEILTNHLLPQTRVGNEELLSLTYFAPPLPISI